MDLIPRKWLAIPFPGSILFLFKFTWLGTISIIDCEARHDVWVLYLFWAAHVATNKSSGPSTSHYIVVVMDRAITAVICLNSRWIYVEYMEEYIALYAGIWWLDKYKNSRTVSSPCYPVFILDRSNSYILKILWLTNQKTGFDCVSEYNRVLWVCLYHNS